MDDPLLVRRLERIGNLSGDLQCLVNRHRATPQPLSDGLAFDELHDQEMTTGGFFEAEHRRKLWIT